LVDLHIPVNFYWFSGVILQNKGRMVDVLVNSLTATFIIGAQFEAVDVRYGTDLQKSTIRIQQSGFRQYQ
jgi:hypothetical protein